MGIIDLFSAKTSKLTEMTTGSEDTLWVKSIKQKAGIKTDEEGTVAYAVTVSNVDGTGSFGGSRLMSFWVNLLFISFAGGMD